jgi:hypothetical protein
VDSRPSTGRGAWGGRDDLDGDHYRDGEDDYDGHTHVPSYGEHVHVPYDLRGVRASGFEKSLQSASAFVAPDLSLSNVGFLSQVNPKP